MLLAGGAVLGRRKAALELKYTAGGRAVLVPLLSYAVHAAGRAFRQASRTSFVALKYELSL